MGTSRKRVPGRRRAAIHDHALSIAAAALFLVCFISQSLTGHQVYNDDRSAHGEGEVGYVEYLESGHFAEATFENWESEFLQMGMFVFLTAFLVQRGSAESKKPEDEPGEGKEEEAGEEGARGESDVPWPVRRGGWALKIYENSLSLAFLLLFLVTFALHAIGGAAEYNEEQAAHGGAQLGTLAFLTTSRFWFESFQNWQSEFLAVLAMVLLSIFLRQKGSPESKPVAKPHRATGGN
jgi:hypothetical protein